MLHSQQSVRQALNPPLEMRKLRLRDVKVMKIIWVLGQPINLPLSLCLCLSLSSRQQSKSWFLLTLILCIERSTKHNKCVTSQVRFQEIVLFSFSCISAKSLLNSCSTSFMAKARRSQGEGRDAWGGRRQKAGRTILFSEDHLLHWSRNFNPQPFLDPFQMLFCIHLASRLWK